MGCGHGCINTPMVVVVVVVTKRGLGDGGNKMAGTEMKEYWR